VCVGVCFAWTGEGGGCGVVVGGVFLEEGVEEGSFVVLEVLVQVVVEALDAGDVVVG
jgi:hypothetical protein